MSANYEDRNRNYDDRNRNYEDRNRGYEADDEGDGALHILPHELDLGDERRQREPLAPVPELRSAVRLSESRSPRLAKPLVLHSPRIARRCWTRRRVAD